MSRRKGGRGQGQDAQGAHRQRLVRILWALDHALDMAAQRLDARDGAPSAPDMARILDIPEADALALRAAMRDLDARVRAALDGKGGP